MNTQISYNRLRGETSPYLMQHAANPVQWYPWGDEAFQKAIAEDKPVFLSVGYSTCHWCHVMAKESFEDIGIAKKINRSFVPIKVDREERPDVDSVYMEACRLITGGGGWPLTVFLTPDKKPFYAGTYYPKTTSYGRPGLSELLDVIEREWRGNRKAILSNADIIAAELNKSAERAPTFTRDAIKSQYFYLKQIYDPVYGGFGQAPKFPMPSNLLFLAEYGNTRTDSTARAMLYNTLEAMYKGGIYDHIGGGFSRYSTDREWLVPHFEKMLYDNAQLIRVYSEAYKTSGRELYKDIVLRTADYIGAELSGDEGGLYAAQDADSGGGEGLYYIWSPEEVKGVLGEEEAERFCTAYGITARGNFEGKSIPNLVGKDTENALSNNFKVSKEMLYKYRKDRMRLATDDKYLAFWNSLAAEAFAIAYKNTLEPSLLIFAKRILTFIKNTLTDGKKVYTSYRDGRLSKGGVLDDIASFIAACIALYSATYEDGYLADAYAYAEAAICDFFDADKGGFFLTADSGERLISRPKEVYDGVTPSGNSVMYLNLLYLDALTEAGIGKLPNGVLEKQREFFASTDSASAQGYYAYAKLKEENFTRLVCVLPKDTSRQNFAADHIEALFAYDAVCYVLPTNNYKLMGGLATFYACFGNTCKPADNALPKAQD